MVVELNRFFRKFLFSPSLWIFVRGHGGNRVKISSELLRDSGHFSMIGGQFNRDRMVEQSSIVHQSSGVFLVHSLSSK